MSRPTTIGAKALIEILAAARVLPGDGWAQRVAEGHGHQGFEKFLVLVRQQVLARAVLADNGYGLQAEARPPIEGLSRRRCCSPRARTARGRLEAARRPPSDAGSKMSRTRPKRAFGSVSMRRSAASSGARELQLAAWARLLRDLAEPPRPDTVEWLALDRIDGLESDVGVIRNWVDPGIPLRPWSRNRRMGSS